MANNANSENGKAEWWQVMRGSVDAGAKEELLGAFGLLDFTMLRPVLAWRAF
jgi:hypothetical protein